MSVNLFSLDGKSSGELSLPKEIFGAEINKGLLAQAMRVYMTNMQAHHGNTKTRGEVDLTTAKWYRQKGTGRARHGAKSAPIFVGGGKSMGPQTRKVILDLPEKMKRAALISALSMKMQEGEVAAVGNLEKVTGKTKEIVGLTKNMEKKTILLVVEGSLNNVFRATKNIKGVNFLTPEMLNVYEVIKHQNLIFTKGSVEKLEQRLMGKAAQND